MRSSVRLLAAARIGYLLGMVPSADVATRTNGLTSSPATSCATSLVHPRPGPSALMNPPRWYGVTATYNWD